MINNETLVSYRIPSYSISNRLNMEHVSDPKHPLHPSDHPPLVRYQNAPLALSKMRVSIPQHILHSMNDVEITPSTEQLRGKSLSITSNMSAGWIGATGRAKQYKQLVQQEKRMARRRNSWNSENKSKKSKNKYETKGSLSLEHHCKFKPGTQPKSASHAASVSYFQALKDPENVLPSSPTKKQRSEETTYADDLTGPAPGAWGNRRNKSFDSFSEKTQQLINGHRATHRPVLNRIAC